MENKSLAELLKERQLELEEKTKATTDKKTKNKPTKTENKLKLKSELKVKPDLEAKIDKLIVLMSKPESSSIEDFINSEDQLIESKKGVSTVRFLGYIASELGITGYSKMAKETLLLKIGIKYIIMSNLIEDPLIKLKITN